MPATVIVKASFELTAGTMPLAPSQDSPNSHDNHWDDDDSRSVYAPSDLAPFKPKADVMLVGDAYAPNGEAVRSLVVRLRVGSIDKAIEVHGDRQEKNGKLGEGEPFVRMALRYERARGGKHTANPVGAAIPNLVILGQEPDPGTPVGFGPIAGSWATRRVLLGRHAHDWSDSMWIDSAMPTDIDGAFFQSAPPDQRLDELRGDERITLENLHPDEPRLVAQLPGLAPVAYVDGSERRQLSLRADTLWIDTTRDIVTISWRGRVDLKHRKEPGKVLVAMANAGEKLSFEDVKKLAVVARISDDQTSDGAPQSRTAVELPFQRKNGIVEEHTAIGIDVFGKKGDIPAWMHERQSGATHIPGVAGKQALHQDDQSPAWLRESSDSLDGTERPSDPGGFQPAGTVGYGTMSPWAGSNGPAQAPARKRPPPPVPPAPPPPPGAHEPEPATMPPPAMAVAAPVAPSSSPGMPAPGGPINIRPPNPVEALQHRARAESQPEIAVHDRPRPASAEVVEVLWYDPAGIDKVHANAEWQPLFESSDADDDDEEPFDFDDEPPAEEDPAVRERRHIVAVMGRGHITTGASLHHAMNEAVDASGHFEPPLVIMTGRLFFPFDELKTLKATLAAVTPLIAGNKELGDTVQAVNELLQTPWLEEGSGDVARKLTDRVRDAFKRGDRLMDPSYLDDHTERILLEQRCYSMRPVFGADHIRALLAPSSAKTRIPVYLPAALQNELPMFKSIPARILAEAHVAQDQFESHDCALKVVALGRVVHLARLAY